MKKISGICFLLSLLTLSGCGVFDNRPEPEIITEGVYRSRLYVTNNTDMDLEVAYKNPVWNLDSLMVVSAGARIKLIDAGDVGSNPSPSAVLSEIRFFPSPADTSNDELLLLELNPVPDEGWIRDTEEEYVASYELIINDSDLN